MENNPKCSSCPPCELQSSLEFPLQMFHCIVCICTVSYSTGTIISSKDGEKDSVSKRLTVSAHGIGFKWLHALQIGHVVLYCDIILQQFEFLGKML